MHDLIKPQKSSIIQKYHLLLDRFRMLLHYYRVSQTRYDIHSTFLHQLYARLEDTHREYYAFSSLEEERQKLLKNQMPVGQGTWGAGSTIPFVQDTRIGTIARWGISSPSKCRLLFTLALYFQPKNILELGTSVGLSSAYLAAADYRAKVVTIDANGDLVKCAIDLHQRLGIHSISCRHGLFLEEIPKVSDQFGPWDMIFLDGHHEENATIQLFEQLIRYSHEETVLILDDIYWSKGMSNAWNYIVSHKDTTLSIDLYHTGVVFFRKNLSKENKVLIPFTCKPWRIGLF